MYAPWCVPQLVQQGSYVRGLDRMRVRCVKLLALEIKAITLSFSSFVEDFPLYYRIER
jgi:hypothetical protein